MWTIRPPKNYNVLSISDNLRELAESLVGSPMLYQITDVSLGVWLVVIPARISLP